MASQASISAFTRHESLVSPKRLIIHFTKLTIES